MIFTMEGKDFVTETVKVKNPDEIVIGKNGNLFFKTEIPFLVLYIPTWHLFYWVIANLSVFRIGFHLTWLLSASFHCWVFC